MTAAWRTPDPFRRTYAGTTWSKDHHLARRRRYANGGLTRTSLGQRFSVIHAGRLSLHDRLGLTNLIDGELTEFSILSIQGPQR